MLEYRLTVGRLVCPWEVYDGKRYIHECWVAAMNSTSFCVDFRNPPDGPGPMVKDGSVPLRGRDE